MRTTEAGEYRRFSITGTKDPYEIETLRAERPEYRRTIANLLGNGISLELHRLWSTPPDIADTVQSTASSYHKEMRVVWINALLQGDRILGDPNGLRRITDFVPKFLYIPTPSDANEEHKKAIALLNEALVNDRDAYAEHRLITDRTDTEKENVRKMAFLTLGAALGATALNVVGLEGVGMAVAGQTDDVLGAVTVGKTEAGGGKSVWKIIKENPLVLGGVVGATAIDLLILPSLFKTDVEVQKFFANAIYWLTATAGSMISSLQSLNRAYTAVKGLDRESRLSRNHELPQEIKDMRLDNSFQKALKKKEISIHRIIESRLLHSGIPQEQVNQALQQVQDIDVETLYNSLRLLKRREIAKIATEEWVSHPYMRWLLIGLGVSLVASEGFGAVGLLEGSPASGVVQAAIGPIETVSALTGSIVFDPKVHELNRRRKFRARRRHAEKAQKKKE